MNGGSAAFFDLGDLAPPDFLPSCPVEQGAMSGSVFFFLPRATGAASSEGTAVVAAKDSSSAAASTDSNAIPREENHRCLRSFLKDWCQRVGQGLMGSVGATWRVSTWILGENARLRSRNGVVRRR